MTPEEAAKSWGDMLRQQDREHLKELRFMIKIGKHFPLLKED